MNKFPDFYKKFEDIILDADTIVNAEKRSRKIMKEINSFIQTLESLKTAQDWVAFGTVLKVLSKEFSDLPVSVFPFSPDKKKCDNLKQNENEINTNLIKLDYHRAKSLLRYTQSTDSKKTIKKYTDKHRLVEKAISLILEHFENDKWTYEDPSKKQIYNFLGQCYLFRSKLALAKGSSIPEKKLEALEKAWEFAKNGSTDLQTSIALEKELWDPNIDMKWFEGQLLKYIKHSDFPIESKPLHWRINDRIQSIFKENNDNKFKPYDEKILAIPITKQLEKEKYLPLYQAKSALRLEKTDEIKTTLRLAVKELNIPLTHHLWIETIDLITEISQNEKFELIWEKSAIHAWCKCLKEEFRIKLSIQLRWYWSRSQALYELAFQAAINQKKYKLAAFIADSQKSRPTIKIQAIEKKLIGKDNDILNQYIEIDSLFASENYKAGLEELKKISSFKKIKTRPIMRVPNQWAAVHFNILNEKEAYAIVIINKKCYEPILLEISSLWKIYKKWETTQQLNSDDNDMVESYFKLLCEESGKAIVPVINLLKEEKVEKIIFIPHGFFHLVPLHASIIDKKPLFIDYLCMFIPSWSMAPIDNENINNDGDFLMSNWQDDPELIEKLKYNEDNKKMWDNEIIKDNTANDVIQEISKVKKPLRLFTLLCHGLGDFINAYHSRFLMKDSDLTHQMIISKIDSSKLKNTKVILTACETDLVSKHFDLIDEHLSLSSAFLRKGASEIIATLFTCYDTYSEQLILKVKNNIENESLCETLKKQQIDWYKDKNETKPLYKIAVYRVIGFPNEKGEK